MKTNLTWFFVGVVVIAAMLVAVVPMMLRSVNGGQEASTSVEQAIQARPNCPTRQVGGVDLPCLGGEFGDAEPRATVVNVWAWWCEPCRTELPLFDTLAATHPDLNVVGVHADTNAANGAAMLNDLDISLPSYQDDRNIFAAKYSLPSVVPITVVIDKDGQVRATYTEAFGSLEEVEDAVNKALS